MGNEIGEANLHANSVALRRIALRKRLVDNGDSVAAPVFSFIPNATATQRNPQSGEEMLADQQNARILLLCGTAPEHRDALLASTVWRMDI